MKIRTKVAAALGAVVALSLTACSGSGGATSPDSTGGGTYNVVLISGQTGALASTVADMQLGLETAADVINKQGGILGKQVKVTVVDDGGDPTQGVSKLQQLLTSGTKPDLVYPGVSSSETLAMLPVLTQNKVLSLAQTTAAAINDPAKYPYHFSVQSLNAVMLAVDGEYMKSKGYKKIAFVLPTGAYGDDLASSMTKIVEDAGGTVVATERFDPAGVDYSSQVQRALAAGPDAIFSDSTGSSTAAAFFQARQTAGALDVPLLTGSGYPALVPSKIAPAGTTDNCVMPVAGYVVQGYDPDSLIGTLAAASKAKAQTGTLYDAGMGYDVIQYAAFAAKTANSTDAEKMAKALETTPIPENYSVMNKNGFAYSTTTHFVPKADYQMIPCSSTVVDNTFWQATS